MRLRSSIFSRVGVSAVSAVVLWNTAVDVHAREQSRDWIVLKDCRLIPNPANDGDSFHVSAGEKEYIFRLYLVDAPETDEMVARRLVDQAKYFGITVRQAIEIGRAAKEFTQQKLSEPFTVSTHMSDALGQSRLKRFYAFVQTKDGDLGEQLVRNGLARIYGYKVAPPALRNSRLEIEKLQQFEDQARQDKIGAWGINVGRSNTRAANPSLFSNFLSGQNSQRSATPAVSPSISASTPKPYASAAAFSEALWAAGPG